VHTRFKDESFLETLVKFDLTFASIVKYIAQIGTQITGLALVLLWVNGIL